jgi:hypothetical protein
MCRLLGIDASPSEATQRERQSHTANEHELPGIRVPVARDL